MGLRKKMDVENFLSKINKLLSYGGDMNVQQLRPSAQREIGRCNGSLALLLTDIKKTYGPAGP